MAEMHQDGLVDERVRAWEREQRWKLVALKPKLFTFSSWKKLKL